MSFTILNFKLARGPAKKSLRSYIILSFNFIMFSVCWRTLLLFYWQCWECGKKVSRWQHTFAGAFCRKPCRTCHIRCKVEKPHQNSVFSTLRKSFALFFPPLVKCCPNQYIIQTKFFPIVGCCCNSWRHHQSVSRQVFIGRNDSAVWGQPGTAPTLHEISRGGMRCECDFDQVALFTHFVRTHRGRWFWCSSSFTEFNWDVSAVGAKYKCRGQCW